MSLANNRTRRSEPRTAADLEARGYKLIAYHSRSWWPMTPKQVAAYKAAHPYSPATRRDGFTNYHVTEIRWVPSRGFGSGRNDPAAKSVGLIAGPPTASTAHPYGPSYRTRKRPIGVYESRVAAAHALLDHLGLGGLELEKIPAHEHGQARYVRETRWSVARALAKEQVPMRARDLEGNLDISDYLPSLGFVGVRTEREISAALRWLVEQGYAESMTFERDDYDYRPGIHYSATNEGIAFARRTGDPKRTA
jgi:hypothetical protein